MSQEFKESSKYRASSPTIPACDIPIRTFGDAKWLYFYKVLNIFVSFGVIGIPMTKSRLKDK